MKKTKKLTNAQLNKLVWVECKRIIRNKYPNTCYTCYKYGLEGSNWHTGHMIAKASLPLRYKYDLNLLRPQCYDCNINCGGQGARFVKRWESEGNNFDELEKQIKQCETMGSLQAWEYLINLLDEYKKMTGK